MAYKDIVVQLGKDNRSAARLNAAIQLAQRHEGRVTGVYVLSRRNIPGFIPSLPTSMRHLHPLELLWGGGDENRWSQRENRWH